MSTAKGQTIATITSTIYKFFCDFVKNKTVDIPSLINICIFVMQQIEAFQITGEQKKEIVLTVFDMYVKEFGHLLDNQVVTAITAGLISTLIDTVIQLDKHKISIKDITSCCC